MGNWKGKISFFKNLKVSVILKEKFLIIVGIKVFKLINKFSRNSEENIVLSWDVFDSVGVEYFTYRFW